MTCGDCCTTVSCGPDFKLPAANALARKNCTAVITSAAWVWYASPSDEVQLRFVAMLASTEGNCVSAFTLGSHGCWSTACSRAEPLSLPFCWAHPAAAATWSGKVEA